MSHRRRIAVLVAVAIALPAAVPAATAEDLHKLFEARCGGCHSDAGPLAQSRLAGRDVGTDQLARFLQRHRGGVPGDHAAAMARMLLAQAETPPRFQQECRICHGPAAPFVRDRLTVRDGELVNRYTGRPVAELLEHHAALPPERQAFYLGLLRRIEGEVHYAPAASSGPHR